MEAYKLLELLKQHDKCLKCGNEELMTEVHGNLFKRECSCGWNIEKKEEK